jgi:hypothetical protein
METVKRLLDSGLQVLIWVVLVAVFALVGIWQFGGCAEQGCVSTPGTPGYQNCPPDQSKPPAE